MNVGDKVVCVEDKDCECKTCNRTVVCPLRLDAVYVLKHLKYHDIKRKWGCQVVGVDAGPNHTHFNVERFRKLDEMKREAGERQKTVEPAVQSSATMGRAAL